MQLKFVLIPVVTLVVLLSLFGLSQWVIPAIGTIVALILAFFLQARASPVRSAASALGSQQVTEAVQAVEEKLKPLGTEPKAYDRLKVIREISVSRFSSGSTEMSTFLFYMGLTSPSQLETGLLVGEAFDVLVERQPENKDFASMMRAVIENTAQLPNAFLPIVSTFVYDSQKSNSMGVAIDLIRAYAPPDEIMRKTNLTKTQVEFLRKTTRTR